MAIKSLPDYKKKKWIDEFLGEQMERTIDLRGLPLQNILLGLIKDHSPDWIAVSARDKRYLNALIADVIRWDGAFPIRVKRWIGGSVMSVDDVPILPFVDLPDEGGETKAYFYTVDGLMPLIKVGAENDAQ